MDFFDFIPMLAGAGVQAYAQRQAAKRQQATLDAARARQLQVQDQAAEEAARAAARFDPQQRLAQQEQIRQELTQQLQQPINRPQITAQGVQVGSTLPEGTGGGDYLAARAREAAKTQESLRALAAIMGRQGAASELRRGEAVGLGDATQRVASLGTHADNLWQAAQPGIETAGTPSLGMMLAGEGLRQYGASRIAGSGLKKKPTLDFSEYGAPSGATGGWV